MRRSVLSCAAALGVFVSRASAVGPISAPIVKGDVNIEFRSVANLNEPTTIADPHDGSGRLFVSQISGKVNIVTNGVASPTPFLDISSTTLSTLSRGMTGATFAPDFNVVGSPGYGKFYTLSAENPGSGTANFGSGGDHQSALYEWQIDAQNPNIINPASKREIMRFDVPGHDHNVDDINFGQDGYLYLSLGDGGNSADNSIHAQETTSAMGKILRIDVNNTSGNGRYSIPASNPFASGGGLGEIYAYGLRNPFRIAFDKATGDLWAGDVGQSNIEEIDKIVLGGNYGWRTKEGTFLYDPNTGQISVDTNPDPSLINPVGQYDHDEGNAIIGGTVYRGALVPQLEGKYIFGEFHSFNPANNRARLFYMDPATGEIKELKIGALDTNLGASDYLYSVETDDNGELYFLFSDGRVVQMRQPSDLKWTTDGSGTWGTSASWLGGVIPNARGATANFTDGVNASTISLTSAQTVGTLNFNRAASYTIAGSATLTIDQGVGNGAILAQQGSHVVSAPMMIAKSTDITVSPGATLSLGGSIATASGITLTKNGSGALFTSALTNSNLNYALNAGTISTSTVSLGTGNTFTQNGGTLAANVTLGTGGVYTGNAGSVLGSFTQTGGAVNGTLSITGSYVYNSGTFAGKLANHGNVTINAANFIAGNGIDNGGVINLSGATIAGGGTSSLANYIGALIQGGGNLLIPIPQNSGTIYANNTSTPLIVSNLSSNGSAGLIKVANNAQLNLGTNLTSAGVITMQGGDSLLSGATITNTGTIKGAGQIANTIANNGIFRAEAGELDLSGTGNTNGATGQIQIATGNTVMFLQGLTTNAGSITLTGGAFDNNNQPLTNNGRIIGRGTIRAASLANNATISFASGSADVVTPVTNSATARVVVTGNATASFLGDVINVSGANLRVDSGSTAVFLGDVTGLGAITGSGTKFYAGSASGGPIAAAGTTVVGFGASLSADYIRESTLAVEGAASVVTSGLPSHVSRVNLLAIDTNATLDLNDNDLIVDATQESTICALLSAGFNGGNWQGAGVTSSDAAASAASAGATPRTALGYASASDIGVSEFDGQNVGGASVLVLYTLSGDANLDGAVSTEDFTALAQNFNSSTEQWSGGDFNYDGFVNALDFNAIASNFGAAMPAPALATLVPEPSVALILAPLAFAVRRRRS